MPQNKTILLIILLLLVLAATFFVMSKNNKQSEKNQKPIQSQHSTRPVDEIESVKDLIDGEYTFTSIDTSSWQTYRNEEAGFEVKIPKNWKLTNAYKQDDIDGNYFYFGEEGVSYNIPEGGKSNSAILVLSSDRYNPKAMPFREFIQKRKVGYDERLYSFSLDGVNALMLGNNSVDSFKGNKVWSISFQLYYDDSSDVRSKEYTIFLGIVQTFKFLK